MSAEAQKYRSIFFLGLTLIIAGALSFSTLGCGSEEATTDEWENTPPVSPATSIEYRIDSLTNQNTHLQQQVDALTAENRNLTARNAELETKLNEAPARPTSTTTMAPSDGASGYKAALGEVRRKNYSAAIQQFEALLNGGISADLEDNCHYWIGESYYGLKQYKEAIEQWEQVLAAPKSNKKADAQTMIARAQKRLGSQK